MAFWSFASIAALLNGSNDLITCPVAGLIVAIAMVGLPNATWPRCLGRSEGFKSKNPNWSYQHTKFSFLCTVLAIHIYDSLNLIVDTLPCKVVQGSYLFTVDLAFCPSWLPGYAPRASATGPDTEEPAAGARCPPGPIQGAMNETKETRPSTASAIRRQARLRSKPLRSFSPKFPPHRRWRRVGPGQFTSLRSRRPPRPSLPEQHHLPRPPHVHSQHGNPCPLRARTIAPRQNANDVRRQSPLHFPAGGRHRRQRRPQAGDVQQGRFRRLSGPGRLQQKSQEVDSHDRLANS